MAATLLIAGIIGLKFWRSVPAPPHLGISPSGNQSQIEPVRPQSVRPADPVAKAVPSRPAAAKPMRVTRIPQQASSMGSPLQATLIAAEDAANAPRVPDEVIIKLETSDPNVVIVWLASPKGAER